MLSKNDFISLWKLRSPSVLSLFYCLQMLRTVSVNGFEYDLRFVPGWFNLFSRVTCHRVSTLSLAIYLFSFFSFRSEYSAFWRCVKAGAAYLVTQLCKVKVSSNWFLVTRWSQLFFKHLKDLLHFTVYTVLKSVLLIWDFLSWIVIFHSLRLCYSNSWLRFEVKLLKIEHEGILDIFCMTFKWSWQSCKVEIQ